MSMNIAAKICGITSPDALEAAIAGGADYIGLVFFAKSPRHLEIGRARELAEIARGRVKIVALTVNAVDETLREIVDKVQPDALQLHGAETPERVAEIKRIFGGTVIKAVPVATAEDAELAERYINVADLILFDSKAASDTDLPGGNGQTFDWAALDGISDHLPFMLSGGLRPGNVASAIARTHPAAVDVSSGVETAPGVKDPEQIRRFLHAVKIAKQS
jgi:phosphoribosylanthranilate isomerase